MQRKQGFPVANCSIKMPDSLPAIPHEALLEEEEPLQRRQQLVNFGHAQWGFNNWSWSVTKQDLDFVELSNGKYTAGVVAFVSVNVKTIDIHRENIGYATSLAPNKGSAIHRARKCAVTNALKETLLSFGGSVATELIEQLDAHKSEVVAPEPPENNQNNPNIHKLPENNQNIHKLTENNQNIHKLPDNNLNIQKLTENNQNIHKLTDNNQNIHKLPENNQNIINKLEPKNAPKTIIRKDVPCVNMKNAVPPIAKAHPMPANLPPANRVPANAPRPPPAPVPPAPRPNSNVSFVLQPVPCAPLFAPPRLAPPTAPVFQNYYEYGPWQLYEPPPRNLLLGRECKAREEHYPPQGCWIKPTIFYDGFWTEQKVKKWVAEQVEKQFPDDAQSPAP